MTRQALATPKASNIEAVQETPGGRLKKIGYTWNQIVRTTLDRNLWRSTFGSPITLGGVKGRIN